MAKSFSASIRQIRSSVCISIFLVAAGYIRDFNDFSRLDAVDQFFNEPLGSFTQSLTQDSRKFISLRPWNTRLVDAFASIIVLKCLLALHFTNMDAFFFGKTFLNEILAVDIMKFKKGIAFNMKPKHRLLRYRNEFLAYFWQNSQAIINEWILI